MSDLDIHPEALAWQLVELGLGLLLGLACSQLFWGIPTTLPAALLVTQHLLTLLRVPPIQGYRAFIGARLHGRYRGDFRARFDGVLLGVDRKYA